MFLVIVARSKRARSMHRRTGSAREDKKSKFSREVAICLLPGLPVKARQPNKSQREQYGADRLSEAGSNRTGISFAEAEVSHAGPETSYGGSAAAYGRPETSFGVA
jgi:hypothetical protein